MLKAQIQKSLWHFDLNLELNIDNQIIVLWGPSGCGKTTTLNVLAGLLNPDQGRITLNERVLFSSSGRLNIPTRHRHIGYLFQDYALFPHKTVLQNVRYGIRGNSSGHSIYHQDPKQLLKSFGIQHLVDRYPGQLSGGEKQRVALARALVVNPQLLLLDEPFSALDYDNKVSLRSEVKRIHEEWPIPFVMVTHDQEDAAYLGDVIMKLEMGQIVDSVHQKNECSSSGSQGGDKPELIPAQAGYGN
ncbi:MAG: ATP-binding cassette domain-containing protein [Syntrophomonadaceae bacterium]|nr:ATP-binding cassette domain-containing protein [Syntrophomonadaceae bacterium]